MERIKIGSEVKWMGSPFEVVKIEKTGLILKQRFSIGVTLVTPVKEKEVLFIK